LAAVAECLYEKAASGDKEQELLVNLPIPFTAKHVIDILAKKCNPRPKSATVAAPKTARGKRKATDAPNTAMQEDPAQEALRRAGYPHKGAGPHWQ
jgi:hypothetical protein